MREFNAAFRRWFGDSKVVDEDGEPLVVYHGSDEDFSSFRNMPTGIYFTSSIEEAGEYAKAKIGREEDLDRVKVYPVYLRIENPYTPEDTADLLCFDAEHLSSKGHDGVIGSMLSNLEGGEVIYYAVFSPSQIKSVHNQGTWSREDPDIRRNPSIAEMAVATATARSAGAVGRRALVPRRVLAIARPGQSILDFGSGPKAMHTMMLRDAGLDVTAHDFPANVRQGVHDPNALDWQYDIVMASNVLNVQSSNPMLQETVDQLIALRQPGGVIVANFPESPRKLPGATAGRIEDYFRLRGLQPHRVGGTKQAPVWEIS